MIESGKILQADTNGKFYANVRSTINDPSGDLKKDINNNTRSYTIRWYQAEGIDGADTSDQVLYDETYSFDTESEIRHHQKELDGYCSYDVTLW